MYDKNLLTFNPILYTITMYEKDDYLSPGERVVLSTHPTAFILLTRLLGVAVGVGALWLIFKFGLGSNYDSSYIVIVTIVLGVVGLFVLLVIYLTWLKTLYIVTNRRVRYYSGVLGIQNKDMTLEDVQNVQYQQSFIATIFNYGDIFIRSAAEDKPIVFQNIPSPRKYADQIRFLANV